MKRADLIKMVESQLEEIGFSRGSWLWQPRSAELIIVIGQTIKTVKLRSNMTKKALIFEMGRIAGYAEAIGAGLVPTQKFEASGAWKTPKGANGAFAGMPA